MATVGPLSLEHRKAISRGQIRRFTQRLDQEKSSPDPKLKRCTKCGRWKDRKRDFLWIKRKLASGVIREYPRPECRKCNAAKADAHRAKLKANGELADAQSRWEANRDKKHRNRLHREWHRMMRGENLGPIWNRYKHELEPQALPREFDSVAIAAYFDRFRVVDEIQGKLLMNGAPMSETDTHKLNRWRKGNPKKLTERQVDEFAIRYDLPPWEAIEAGKMAA